MIYNSNGNNAPYQSGGNAKVQKELKALQEAINLVDANFNNYVDENDEDIVRIDNNIDAIELSVSDIGTRLSTAEGKITGYDTLVETDKVQAQDADFHNVVAGKYVFQNGVAITGTNICKIADGSVVYATDGTNAILIDYTNKDAWVAKAKVEANQYFRIYSNGVLTFTQSGGWSVYVLGNDFSTDDFTVPEETPISIETGVTIGGTLYAALARDYEFDNITVTSATIDSATVTLLTAPNATITDLTATNETVADLTVTDEADINGLVNAKRNIQDEINGMISVDSHPTNVQVYIGVRKFTGTYNLKLTHEVNGAVQTLFTATIVWNGKYPIVQYHEYADNEPIDYLYSMVLTDDALYFVTQGAGNLYYSYDAFGGALAPTSSEYPNIPYQPNDVIADYITTYHDRTVFFGNGKDESGVDILGEMKADIIQLPEGLSITDLDLDGNLSVDGTTTLNGDTTAGNITADKVDSDELIGKSLKVKDGDDEYLTADENGVAVKVDTAITADVTLTGDLTQTGDQNITGSVEISEKETINNLEPEGAGHYVDHDVWKYNNTFLTNGTNYPGLTTEPAGTAQPPILVASNLYALSDDNANALYQFTESVKYQVIKINGSWCCIDNRSIFNPVDMADPRDHRIGNEGTYDYKHYIDENNHVYRYKESDDEFLQAKTNYQGGYGFETITDATTIANLRSKLSRFTIDLQHATYYERSYKTIKTLSTDNATFISSSAPYPTDATLYGPFDLYYVQYKEYVREIDPNHQYTPADEVLTVKGSEKVTRDLKVQGFIYQDEYNKAVLPNIDTNTINGDGGVLIIGDLD